MNNNEIVCKRKQELVGKKFTNNKEESFEIIDYVNATNITVQFEDGVIKEGVAFNNIKKGVVAKPQEKIGKRFENKIGEWFEIIDYKNKSDVTVLFDDGTVLEKVYYRQVKKKAVYKPENRIGKRFKSKNADDFTIIEYFNSHNITIQFDNGYILRKANYFNIKSGNVKNKTYPIVYGVGYIGVGKYDIKIPKKIYSSWRGVLERAYSKIKHEKFPTYMGCSVVEEWHNFQNFAAWFEENYNPEIMQGWHLDKDILVKGNKIYSPETCCFVPAEINTLFLKSDKARGNYPIGVSYCKREKKIIATLGKRCIGYFETVEEAFQAYKIAKESYIKKVADKWKNLIAPRVYEALYKYEVEITD